MGLQRAIRSSSESSTVAFKIGMGHFHSQESGRCSYTAVSRLLRHQKPYFLGELALLIKQEAKLKDPCCGGPLEYVCLATEKAAPFLLVKLVYRVKDGPAIRLEFP